MCTSVTAISQYAGNKSLGSNCLRGIGPKACLNLIKSEYQLITNCIQRCFHTTLRLCAQVWLRGHQINTHSSVLSPPCWYAAQKCQTTRNKVNMHLYTERCVCKNRFPVSIKGRLKALLVLSLSRDIKTDKESFDPNVRNKAWEQKLLNPN